MLKKLVLIVAGLFLLATPVFVSAQSSDIQSQIAALQTQIKALLAQIAQLQGQSNTGECVTIGRTLTLGSSGIEVTNLQNYLIGKGYLSAGNNTGYYGFLTASAVGQLQVSLGIVSSQSDPAYGYMGPRTRAAIRCGGVIPPQGGAHLSAFPTSGVAPLSVSFTGTGLSGNTQYIMDFGDGSNSGSITSAPCGGGPGCSSVSATHTYQTNGVFTATLQTYNTCSTSNPPCMMPVQTLGTATITVGGTTNTASLSASPTSGNAPLKVTFSNMVTGGIFPAGGFPYINYGDGSPTESAGKCTDPTDYCTSPGINTHTYTAPGTYVAAIYRDTAGPTQILGSTRVTVSSDDMTSPGLKANPTSGKAPLTVTFTVTGNQLQTYHLNFGDGDSTDVSLPEVLCQTDAGVGPCQTLATKTVTHTYKTAGVFSAILEIPCNAPPGAACAQGPEISVTITVTDQSGALPPTGFVASCTDSAGKLGWSTPSNAKSSTTYDAVLYVPLNDSCPSGWAHEETNLSNKRCSKKVSGGTSITVPLVLNHSYTAYVITQENGVNTAAQAGPQEFTCRPPQASPSFTASCPDGTATLSWVTPVGAPPSTTYEPMVYVPIGENCPAGWADGGTSSANQNRQCFISGFWGGTQVSVPLLGGAGYVAYLLTQDNGVNTGAQAGPVSFSCPVN